MNLVIYRDWSEKAAVNAISLAQESRVLFDAKYLPRAYYLAHMSMEESAKSILLYAMSVSNTPESEIGKALKLLQSHKKKIEFLIASAESSSEELSIALGSLKTSLINHINDLKNNTMYVSCDANTVFTPEEKIESVDIELHIDLAEKFSRYAKSLFMQTISAQI